MVDQSNQTELLVPIIGAGGFARELADLLVSLEGNACRIRYLVEAIYWTPSAVLDSAVECLDPKSAMQNYYLAIGDSAARKRIAELLLCSTPGPPRISATAKMGARNSVGPGSVICMGAIVTNDVCIGRHVQIHAGATIGHDAVIEDFCTVLPNAVVSGAVRLGEGCTIGANASLRDHITVAPRTTIGMGSVVLNSITEPGVYVGNPARRIR